MVEVFKTTVKRKKEAKRLIHRIHSSLRGCKANFDLNDVDKILRIETNTPSIDAGAIINLLKESGHEAEVLPDIVEEDDALSAGFNLIQLKQAI